MGSGDMTRSIRVVIADDHHVLLDGLRQALGSLPDIEIVAAVATAAKLVATVRDLAPDVLLVDIEFPDGSGIAAYRSIEEPPPAVVMTMHGDDEHRRRAEAAGFAAFLSKAAPLADVAAALRAAARGERPIAHPDPTVVLDRHREATLVGDAESLTPRERDILALLARGISGTGEIAAELYISQKTVKNHLASIYDKLHVADRAQAAVEAIRIGLGPAGK